jgi:hypothetical protein
MIYIYRRQPSASACLLADLLGGRKVSQLRRVRVKTDAVVIAWGEAVKLPCPVLNGEVLLNKLEEAQALKEGDVPTISVSRTAVDDWLGRSLFHHEGMDLLRPLKNPHYWVKKEGIVEEYRIHSFMGRSLRAGVKIPRDGVPHHDWIRSGRGGWRIAYRPHSVKQKHRDLAHKAVRTLGLDFGAVDIGRTKTGKLIVLEVNRAPGIEAGTVEAYASAIRGWAAERG